MSQRSFARLAALIFALQAGAHLVRAALGTPATLGSFAVPVWFSYVAVALLGVLAVAGFRSAR